MRRWGVGKLTLNAGVVRLCVAILMAMSLSVGHAASKTDKLVAQFKQYMRDKDYESAELLVKAGVMADPQVIETFKASCFFAELLVRNSELAVDVEEARRIAGILGRIEPLSMVRTHDSGCTGAAEVILSGLFQSSRATVDGDNGFVRFLTEAGFDFDPPPVLASALLYELVRLAPNDLGSDIERILLDIAEERGIKVTPGNAGSLGNLVIAALNRMVENRQATVDYFFGETPLGRYAESGIKNERGEILFDSFANFVGGLGAAEHAYQSARVQDARVFTIPAGYYCANAGKYYPNRLEDGSWDPLVFVLGLYNPANAELAVESCQALLGQLVADHPNLEDAVKSLAAEGKLEEMQWVLQQAR